jgi:hypothetical protein
MMKQKRQTSLNKKQLLALNKFHKSQVPTEIAFAILLVTIISVHVVSVWPGYILVLLASLALLFGFGLNLTIRGSNLPKLGEPLISTTKSLRIWLQVAWFSMLGTFSATLILIIIKSPWNISSILLILLVLWSIISVLLVLVKAQLLWKNFNKRRVKPMRLIVYSALGSVILIASVTLTYTTNEIIAFNSNTVSDGNLELGQSEVRQVGKNGEKLVTRNLIFGFITSTSQKDPQDQISAKGTRRYQYMYCSDGSSRYYEADKFKDPNVGFTHQSPDYCAQNGQGTMTTLADAPQPKTQYITTPSYRVPTMTRCYSFSSYSVDCYSY